MENGQYVEGSYWFYAPSKPAAIILGCCFLGSGLYHSYQCFQYRSWRITGFLPWSALLFVIGFTLRAIGAYHYDNLKIFISSTVFIYAGPPIYELSNYVVLSRLLHYIPHLSPLHPARVISTFLGVSTIVEALTGNGAALAVNSENSPGRIAAGKALLKATLILQLFVLLLFVGVAGRFHHNCMKAGYLKMDGPRMRIVGVLSTLYISSALIGTRTIYRTIEYFLSAAIQYPKAGENFDPTSITPIIRYEWYFYVFEALLMICNTLMLNVRHPGKYLPRLNTVYLAEDGVEREGAEFKDNRNWVAKIFDPFDLVGLIMGSDKNDRWWEKGAENRATHG